MSKPTHRLAALFVAAAIVFTVGSASAADLPVSVYVQDGLVTQWDAIFNAIDKDGNLCHDSEATTWRDCKQGISFTLSGVTIEANALAFSSASSSHGVLSSNTTDAFPTSGNRTVEIVCCFENTSQSLVLMGSSTTKMSLGNNNNLILTSGSGIGQHPSVSVDTTYTFTTCYTSATELGNLYRDGSSVSATGSGYWSGPDSNVWLGRKPNGGCLFTGKIYAIRVYNRYLTAEEVAQNATMDAIRFKGADPAAYGFRFNETSQKWECRVTASATDDGTLTANGAAIPAEGAWFEQGTVVKAVFTPKDAQTFRFIGGVPADAMRPSVHEVEFALSAPTALTVGNYPFSDSNILGCDAAIVRTDVEGGEAYLFQTSGETLSFAARTMLIKEILVVGGGGAGGPKGGGGGGGGEALCVTNFHLIPAGAKITTAIGMGAMAESTDGQPTTFDDGVFTITARGGKGSTSSSGGASGNGFAGGTAATNAGGGGGGASEAGHNGTYTGGTSLGGQGGDGLWCSITGTAHCYGSGGGGGSIGAITKDAQELPVFGMGGAESGGRGGVEDTRSASYGNGQDGVNGLGGGGGSRGHNGGVLAGLGGSGAVAFTIVPGNFVVTSGGEEYAADEVSYGPMTAVAGETVLTAPESFDISDVQRAECRGYRLLEAGEDGWVEVTSSPSRSYTVTADDIAVGRMLEWQWEVTSRLSAIAGGFGTMTVTENGVAHPAAGSVTLWITNGSPVEVVFTPTDETVSGSLSGLPENAEVVSPFVVRFALAGAVDIAFLPTPPASLYVQDGLLACFDGIENYTNGEGRACHDSTATKWRDSVQGLAFSLSGVTIGEKGLAFASAAGSYGSMDATSTAKAFPTLGDKTFELVGCYANNSQGLLFFGSVGYRLTFGYTGSWTLGNNSVYMKTYPATLNSTNTWSIVATAPEDSLADVTVRDLAQDSEFLTSNGSYQWSGGNDQAWLGRKHDGSQQVSKGEIFAIRSYSRVLTTAELQYNADLDKVRFKGADFGMTMAPHGVRYNSAARQYEFRILAAETASGTFEVNGAALSADGIWLAQGASAKVVFKPNDATKFYSIGGIPMSANRPTVHEATFAMSSPVELTVTPFAYEDDNFVCNETELHQILTGGRAVYIFTSPTNREFAVFAKRALTFEETLVVGGGGAGAWNRPSSGGAGGTVASSDQVHVLAAGDPMLIRVGLGGYAAGVNGFDSAFSDAVVSLAAAGGAAGVSSSNAGGKSGTGMRGGNGSFAQGGAGGDGLHSDITGEWHTYGSGGGGGASNANCPGGAGGAESGGRGGANTTDAAILHGLNGANGLGGGGGGRGDTGTSNSGLGGSGAVILAFTVGDTTAKHFAVEDVAVAPIVDGAATPKPVVKNADGETLTENVHYSVAYADNTMGHTTGQMIVTGLAGDGFDYSGILVRKTFAIAAVRFVSPNGSSEANGTSWDDAMDAATAFSTLSDSGSEIWLKEGTYALAAPLALSKAIAVRGGYAGDAANPSRRGGKTVLDGEGVASAALSVACSVAAADLDYKQVLIEDITFTRGKNRAITESGTHCSTYRRCDFVNVCTTESGNGYIVNFDCSGSGRLQVEGCGFYGNVSTGSGGLGGVYVGLSCAACAFDGCTFMTNGVPFDLPPRQSVTFKKGRLIYSFCKLTMSNCRFVANRGFGDDWGLIAVNTGSPFEIDHCAFVANEILGGRGSYGFFYSHSGNASNTKSVIRNCTFAYNLLDTSSGPLVGGTSAASTSLLVENCIFHGTKTGSAFLSTTTAHDVWISSGKGEVSYSLFDSTEDNVCFGPTADASRFVRGEGLVAGNALFVTDDATAEACLLGSAIGFGYDEAKLAEICAFDVHVKSTEGYRTNADDEWHTAEDETSPAIDGGDPEADFSNEPGKNGGCLNLGCYGNTDEASQTAYIDPQVAGLAVTFPSEYTQPTVTITMGGEGSYAVGVKIYASETGDEDGEWYESATLTGTNRAVIVWRVPGYFPTSAQGGKVHLKVVMTRSGSSVTITPAATDVPSDKSVPDWSGKGGDPATVIHVRAGATGKGDGTSWTDAYGDLHHALVACTSARHEVWLAGTNVTDAADAGVDYTCANTYLRGGFAGVEDTPEERAAEAVSVVDGRGTGDGLTYNATGVKVERIVFRNCYKRGFSASGGSYAFTDCRFEKCGVKNAIYGGHGAYFVYCNDGGSFTRCTFAENICTNTTGSAEGNARGVALFIEASGRFYFDDCLFVSNGLAHTAGIVSDVKHVCGSAICSGSAPLTLRNTRFVANRNYATGEDELGGCVCYFRADGSYEMAFTNVLFLANESIGAGSRGSHLIWAWEAKSMSFDQCTFAYNVVDESNVGGCIWASCPMTIRNSVFHGNRYRSATDTRDIVDADSAVSISYSLFNATNSYPSTATLGKDVLVGDARLATSTNDFAKLVKVTDTGRIYLDWDQPAAIMSLNVHLRGRGGYTDEKTGLKVKGEGKTSPCVDAGDPESDWSQEPKPNGKRINMGCYGGTPWATCSPPGMAVRVR